MDSMKWWMVSVAFSLDNAERRGVMQGIKIMEQRILLACENGNLLNIEGKAYFIRSDIDNLRGIFADLEQGNL